VAQALFQAAAPLDSPAAPCTSLAAQLLSALTALVSSPLRCWPALHCAAAALFYRLKQKGFEECKAYSDAYAACITGRVLSVAWACRKEMKELSDCMSQQ